MPIALIVLVLLGAPLATGLITIDAKHATFAVHKDALSHGVADYSNVNK